MTGIEPVTSSLPRKCSTTELHEQKSGKRGSNSRHSAWKADALPTELFPHNYLKIWWGEKDSNLRRLRRQIYSLLPLATRVSPHTKFINFSLIKSHMEPPEGFEPPTRGLQNPCSTPELWWLLYFIEIYYYE